MASKTLVIRPATKPNSDINVTPLVDVVLVLLIIFMVVTPLLEKDIDVRVPKTEEVQEQTEVPPDQLVVGIDPAGELSINQERIPPSEYIDRLRRILAAKPANDKLVFFTAADAANYAKVVTALDGARQAGAQTLGMMTELPSTPPPPPPGSDTGGQPGAPGEPSPGTPAPANPTGPGGTPTSPR